MDIMYSPQTLQDLVKKVGGSDTNPKMKLERFLAVSRYVPLCKEQARNTLHKNVSSTKREVWIELSQLFEKKKAMLDAQFILPSTYMSYKNKEDFAAFYPFVTYQFKLIMKVLDSFSNMSYVDKQVKGNERSLLNITFSIAKETAECEVGEFIPFDKFFGAMFQGSMQHLGQRAMANAREALNLITDEERFTSFLSQSGLCSLHGM